MAAVVDLGPEPPANHPGIAAAIEALRAGEIVAYATETVYGLACDALNETACARLCELKGRTEGHTLPVQVYEARPPHWPWPIPGEALALLSAFAPGPITVVVPGGKGLAPQAVGETGGVALRVPNHPVARAVLKAFGGPLACPSANPTGQPPATDAGTVVRYFPAGITAVLSGGPAPGGTASTVVAVSDGRANVLRQGVITEREVIACLEEYWRSL